MSADYEPPRVCRECAAACGKQVYARTDGKAYLCRRCWSGLFSTLFEIIRTAPENSEGSGTALTTDSEATKVVLRAT